jgi:hypothetical protein
VRFLFYVQYLFGSFVRFFGYAAAINLLCFVWVFGLGIWFVALSPSFSVVPITAVIYNCWFFVSLCKHVATSRNDIRKKLTSLLDAGIKFVKGVLRRGFDVASCSYVVSRSTLDYLDS